MIVALVGGGWLVKAPPAASRRATLPAFDEKYVLSAKALLVRRTVIPMRLPDEPENYWESLVDDALAKHADALDRPVISDLRAAVLETLADAPGPQAVEFLAEDGSCRLCRDSGMVNAAGVMTPAGVPLSSTFFACICPQGIAARRASQAGSPIETPLPAPARPAQPQPRYATVVEAILAQVDTVMERFRESIDSLAWATLRLDLALALERRQDAVWMGFLTEGMHCGLCGNNGWVRLNDLNRPCICPNGRAVLRHHQPPSYPPGILAPGHPRWDEFVERLAEACNIQGEGEEITWECDNDWRRSIEILLDMGLDVAGTILVCHERGGGCDCEILLNVLDPNDEELS